MRHYIGIITKDEDSAYGISFPDLLGCTSAGDTLDELYQNAPLAMRLWAEHIDEVPEPSALETLLAEDEDFAEDVRNGGIVVSLPLITVNRRQRYNLMLDPGTVEAIDAAARIAGVNRSEFVNRTMLEALGVASVGG